MTDRTQEALLAAIEAAAEADRVSTDHQTDGDQADE